MFSVVALTIIPLCPNPEESVTLVVSIPNSFGAGVQAVAIFPRSILNPHT